MNFVIDERGRAGATCWMHLGLTHSFAKFFEEARMIVLCKNLKL
jgi:hypothetical protein